MRKKLAVAAYDGLLGFEYAIAAELFALVRPGMEDIWYEFMTCRVERGPLKTSHGLAIQPNHGSSEIASADIVVVPGWRSWDEPPKPAFINALRAAAKNGARIVSICTGAFVLGYAELLDGKRATTHWLHTKRLQQLFPQTTVIEDSLYIHDGNILTSAGSSAGMDLCLSIIRDDFGVEVANMVARRMVAPVHREGGQSQYVQPEILSADDADFIPILEWMTSNLGSVFTLDEVANRFDISLRTLHRRFRETTGQTPLQWLVRNRVVKARAFLEATELNVDQVARKSGLGSTANLRKHFLRILNTTPGAYRSAFRAQK